MPAVERVSRSRAAQRGRRGALRFVAASSIGLLLTGAAYQASFANVGSGVSAGPRIAQYGGEGISAPGVAAIAAGAGLALWGLLAGGGAAAGAAFLAGTPHECRERFPVLPENAQITELRLVPISSTLEAGYCRCFHLEARNAADRKWYSVTHRAESTIDVAEPTSCLVRQEGAKNIFCVPITAPPTCNGESVVLVGTFTPPNQPAWRAEARVQVRVPQGSLITRPPLRVD